jgi:hypothetical protein
MWPETPQRFKTGGGAEHPDGFCHGLTLYLYRATMARCSVLLGFRLYG